MPGTAEEIDMLGLLCGRGWIPHRWGQRQENADAAGVVRGGLEGPYLPRLIRLT